MPRKTVDDNNAKGETMTQKNPVARLVTVGLALFLTAGSATASGISCSTSPVQVVTCISRDIADGLAARAEGELADTRKRLAIIEEAAAPHTDFPYMAELVLGDAWHAASPQEQERFVEAFSSMLLWTFSEHVARHAGERVTFEPVKGEPPEGIAIVRTRIKPAMGHGLLVDYRLRARDGRWRLFDVSVDGMSVVTLFQSSFQAEARRLGLDRLTRELVARNRRLQNT